MRKSAISERGQKAAQIVADNYPLYNDYPALFNSNSLSSMPEVLLWRAYDANLTPAVNHFVVGYLQRNGGGNSGYTRSMINTYLMQTDFLSMLLVQITKATALIRM